MTTAQSIDADHLNLAGAGEDQYLTFILRGEEYGVDILRVQEIRGWDNVTPIPNTPSYIKGVMNLRGTIVPIVDLRERFAMEVMPYGPTTVVIVLKVRSDDRERVMGIVVDAVSDVYNIGADDLKPPPDFGEVVSVEYVQGLATVDEKMVIVLDIDHMLTSGELRGVERSAA
jgi:purine-binding chemotaxis protein CheW